MSHAPIGSSVVFCLLTAVAAAAQNGAVRGKVVDSNELPLEGVAVVLEFQGGIDRKIETETDADGDFVRMGVPIGAYRLVLKKQGYETRSEEIKVEPGPAPTRLGSLVLGPAAEKMASQGRAAAAIPEAQQYFQQGLAEVEGESYAAAIDSFESVIELEPTSAEAHFNLGVVHRKMQDPAKAAAHFAKAGEIDPGYYEAHVALGNIYAAEARWNETMDALEKAVAVRPDSVQAWYDYGAAALNAGEFPKAHEAFRKLLELDPAHAAGHYQMGMLLVNQGDNQSAIVHVETYLELEPEGAQAETARGVLQYLKK